MSLINIGSAIAFNIVIALGGLGIFTANIIVIGCMIRKRVLGEPLLPSKFDLGKAGLYINITAITYLSLAIVLICFPEVPNPSLADMNWSIVMFAVLVVFAMGYYYVIGKDKYDGPVEYVKRQ